MTYIDYCNQFWRCHLEHSFTPPAAMIYFKLLDLANTMRWKNPFICSDAQLNALTGIASRNTLKAARKQLVDAELITCTEGGHGRGTAYKATYTLLQVGEVVEKKLSLKVSKNDSLNDSLTATDGEENYQPEYPQDRQKLTPISKGEEKTRENKGGATPAPVSVEPLPEPWATILAGPACRVQQLDQPLTADELRRLLAEYTDQAVDKVLRAMGNHKQLLQKNVSAFGTVQKWLGYDEAEGKPVRRPVGQQVAAVRQPGPNPYEGQAQPASAAAWLEQRQADQFAYPDEL